MHICLFFVSLLLHTPCANGENLEFAEIRLNALREFLPETIISELGFDGASFSNVYIISLWPNESIENVFEEFRNRTGVECNLNPDLQILVIDQGAQPSERVKRYNFFGIIESSREGLLCYEGIENLEVMSRSEYFRKYVDNFQTRDQRLVGISGGVFEVGRIYSVLINSTDGKLDNFSVAEVVEETSFIRRMYYSFKGFRSQPGEPVMRRPLFNFDFATARGEWRNE